MVKINSNSESTNEKITISQREYTSLLAVRDAYKLTLLETLEKESENIEIRKNRDLANQILKESLYQNNKFNAILFVNLVLNVSPEGFKTPLNALGGDVIFRYNPSTGIYTDDGVPYIEHQLEQILEEETTTSMYSQVVKQLQVKSYIDPREFEENQDIVVLNNGSFNIVTGELGPHSPFYYAKSKIPITYDPEADCPAFKKFLREVIPNSVDFYQEWLGYHLLKNYVFQRCVVCLGDGDNGKSTLLQVQTAFLGVENISTQSLYRLSTNRFSPAELFGKTANIAADIGPDELKHTGTIKMLTGGDYITAEFKHRDLFQFKNYAKLTFSCNQLPRTPDETLAFFKRFIVLVFEEPIPKEKQDPNLLEKLTTPEELSGIFNFAYEGLKRILENRRLDEPGDAMERKELYLAMSDPVTGFISENIIEGLEIFEIKQDLVSAFFAYCKKKGFIALSERKFYEEFKKKAYVRDYHPKLYSSEHPNGKQYACYRGVKLVNFKGKKYYFSKKEFLATQGSQSRLEY